MPPGQGMPIAPDSFMDGRTIARSHSVFQSVEARDAMVESGMERGLSEGFDRLDGVLTSLQAPVH